MPLLIFELPLKIGQQTILTPLKQGNPTLFYPMLNNCPALPLLPEWAEYLWANGREQNLITLPDNGEGQGYAAWRVLPAHEVWQSVVQAGLHSGAIAF